MKKRYLAILITIRSEKARITQTDVIVKVAATVDAVDTGWFTG